MTALFDARDDVVEELVAGTPARGEYRCAGCGYGVTVYTRLPRCPMCGAEDAWEQLDFMRSFKDAFGEGPSLP